MNGWALESRFPYGDPWPMTSFKFGFLGVNASLEVAPLPPANDNECQRERGEQSVSETESEKGLRRTWLLAGAFGGLIFGSYMQVTGYDHWHRGRRGIARALIGGGVGAVTLGLGSLLFGWGLV
jgi:hypothetical protein